MSSFFSIEVNIKGGIIDCYNYADAKFKKVGFDPSVGVDFGSLILIRAEVILFGGDFQFKSPGVAAARRCCWTDQGWINGWRDAASAINTDYIKVYYKDTGRVDKIEYYEPNCPVRELRYEQRLPEVMQEVKFLQVGGCYHLLVLENPQDGKRHIAIVGMDPEYPGQYWIWHDSCLS